MRISILNKLLNKLLYKKDRTIIIYRHIKKLESSNIIEKVYQSSHKIQYKLSLHGYLIKLSLEYFPEIIIGQKGDKQR